MSTTSSIPRPKTQTTDKDEEAVRVLRVHRAPQGADQ